MNYIRLASRLFTEEYVAGRVIEGQWSRNVLEVGLSVSCGSGEKYILSDFKR
jgi:hypothetical protein